MYPELENLPYDARFYAKDRLLSFARFTGLPLVDDGFFCWLPRAGYWHYFGREVEAEFEGHKKRFELWSFNSVQLPYYPGICTSALELRPSEILEQRRFNGGLGRFDPSLAPQYYNLSAPWRGFMLSPFRLPAFEISTRAEYVPLIRVWEPESDGGYIGKLRADFLTDLEEADRAAVARIHAHSVPFRYDRANLWNDYPVFPQASDFTRLRSHSYFDMAIDTGSEIQRGIQEKQAFARMAEAWAGYDYRNAPALADVEVLPADDSLLGVWIHGIKEINLKFFLGHARVPYFLVHELTAEEPTGEIVTRGFVSGTEIGSYLDPVQYELDRIALETNGNKYTVREEPTFRPGIVPRDLGVLPRNVSALRALAACKPTTRPLPGSPSTVSIPESDDERSLEDSKLNSSGNVEEAVDRPRTWATVMTFPALGVSVTSVLKFQLAETFTPTQLRAWLEAAERLAPGGSWRRIFRIPRRPRVDYFVEFSTIEAALRVRGLINAGEGEIRDSSFVNAADFKAVMDSHQPLLEAPETAESSRHHPRSRPRLLLDRAQMPKPGLPVRGESRAVRLVCHKDGFAGDHRPVVDTVARHPDDSVVVRRSAARSRCRVAHFHRGAARSLAVPSVGLHRLADVVARFFAGRPLVGRILENDSDPGKDSVEGAARGRNLLALHVLDGVRLYGIYVVRQYGIRVVRPVPCRWMNRCPRSR
ncbi:hypothetical protein K438DRAFT_1986312 [Mycena galopus ATCC 62051]|nr:hypothetical protein K438DRAFT_1986312 [Mycena galopus ATCC 62051]